MCVINSSNFSLKMVIVFRIHHQSKTKYSPHYNTIIQNQYISGDEQCILPLWSQMYTRCLEGHVNLRHFISIINILWPMFWFMMLNVIYIDILLWCCIFFIYLRIIAIWLHCQIYIVAYISMFSYWNYSCIIILSTVLLIFIYTDVSFSTFYLVRGPREVMCHTSRCICNLITLFYQLRELQKVLCVIDPRRHHAIPETLFNQRTDVLLQHLVKSRSCQFGC